MLRNILSVAALTLGVLTVNPSAQAQPLNPNFLRRDAPFDVRGYRGGDHDHHHHHHWQRRTFCEYGDALRFAHSLRHRGYETTIRRDGIDWAVFYR